MKRLHSLAASNNYYQSGEPQGLAGHNESEEALKRTCEELNQIINTIIDGIRVVDRDFNVIRVNDKFSELSGVNKDEVLRRKCYEVFPGPLCHTSDCPLIKVLNGEKVVKYDVDKTRHDGSTVSCNVTATPFRSPDGELIGIVENFRNITERKRAEEELRNSRQQLLNIIEFLPDATFVIDKDSRVIAWNRAIEEMTGIYKEDIIGKGEYMYAVPFYGEQRPILIDLVMQWNKDTEKQYDFVRKRGKTLYTEFFVPSLNRGKGAYLWGTASPLYDAVGNLVGAIESIRDVTEKKAAEKELRLSEERFAKSFNGNPIPMIISTLSEGRLLDVNESFIRITGCSRDEVIGYTSNELNIWLDPENRARFMKMLREEGSVRNLESPFQIKSGDIRIGLFSADLVELNGEKYVLSTINDITERKHFERKIAWLERLNLIGEMAAGIAHEIRNPMTTVRGFLQMLAKKEECLPFHRYYNLMIDELDRANAIITEFLTLAKNKPANLKRVNLNSIIEALYPLIYADAMASDNNIEIELNSIPDLCLDEKEMRQLILNLTRNGLEAMPDGGCLTIRTFVDGGDVILSIEDQGSGIEAGVIEKLGTPFFTTKDDGTGLGLATCYSIATRHKATVKLETGPEGTIFLVRFKQDPICP